MVVLALLGALISAYGTLIGSGGGFLLVPLLLFLYPDESTGTVTNISLAVVSISAIVGTVAYARLKRIDYRVGAAIAAGSVPGSIVGALAARYVPRGSFDTVFGGLLLILGAYLLFVRDSRSVVEAVRSHGPASPERLRVGIGLALAIGFVSSFFGIGGGVIQVPMLSQIVGLPLSGATATSQLILAVQSLIGTATHVLAGEYTTGLRRTLALSIGACIGAPLGARLSWQLKDSGLLRLLAAGLFVVGARLVLPH
ncbi:MAG: sulfite exporter TauE/SafE family protein [Chloroflexi bacterium]|nr:sulfite exporter TauE/SafE family protein [Chloroflexota bacterium]